MLLTSTKNPVVQSAKALLTAKGRREQDAFLCDGEHMTGEALRVCPEKVSALFVEDGQQERFAPLLALARQTECAVYEVSAAVLETISQVKTPQGIAAVCGLPKSCPLERQGQKLLLMENVQDPGNVGTILRTLDAAGFDGCILTPGCADPFAPKTMRATMGSLFRVPMTFVENSAEAACWLRTNGWAVIGAELRGQPFYQRGTRPDKLCVLIGNEGAGLTEEILAQCSFRYKLPMRGGAESLNAGIAAAVMMYDLMNR